MINLLVFACVIWCLLEFRIAGKQAWLSGSAFLYGAGMANDWTMVGYFPVFLAAILWLKGWSFFNVRFLLRMALWGLAGLSLYLVLPAVQALHPVVHLGFWSALKANLKAQREALSWFPKGAAACPGADLPAPAADHLNSMEVAGAPLRRRQPGGAGSSPRPCSALRTPRSSRYPSG